MIVRFFEHGKVKKGATTRTGGGGAARNYLLFDKQDKSKPRVNARLIYGDDVATTEIINGIKNSKIYTSGVLSFAPEESITESQKIEIIESFEANLFPGMTQGEYSGYWVEHLDKERQELHFVFADIHLPTGRSLTVYYHHKDLKLVDSWKDLINLDYGLADPNDTARQKPFRLKGYEYALKKQQQQKEQQRKLTDDPNIAPLKLDEEAIGEWLVDEIIADESIQTQDDVVALIGKTFEITRIDKDGKSISIKNPAGGRNIKLKGMMYEQEFTRQRFESLGATQTRKVVDRTKLVERNRVEVERRFYRLQQRFKHDYQPVAELDRNVEFEFNQPSPSSSPSDGGRAYQHSESELDGFDHTAGANPTGFTELNRAGDPTKGADREAASGFETDATGLQNPEQDADGRVRSGAAATSPSEYEGQPEAVSAVLPGFEQATSGYTGKGDYHRVADFLFDDVADSSNDGDGVLLKTPAGQTATAVGASRASGDATGAKSDPNYDEGTTDPTGSSGIEYGDGVAKRPESITSVNYSQESASGWLWAESEGAEGVVGRSRSIHEQQEQSQLEQPLIDSQGINDGGSPQPERAYRSKLTDIVARFAQESGQSTTDDTQREPTANRAGDFTVSRAVIDTAIQTAVQSLTRTAPTTADSTDPSLQPADNPILGRIKQATASRSTNTEKRTRRIATLAEQHPIDVSPLIDYHGKRRQRRRKFVNRFTNLNEQLTAVDVDYQEGYQQRAKYLQPINAGLKEVTNRYANHAQQFSATTNKLERVVAAVCSLIKGIIGAFKQLFTGLKQRALGYAGEGVLHHVNQDGTKGQQATSEEAKDYVNSHPYDLSGYAQLKLTVDTWDKQKKEKENTPRLGW